MTVRLSLVVTTIGRVPEFVRLVRSVAGADRAPEIEIVVVDQSPDRRCIAALEEFGPAFPWQATTSGRGASRGRNAGIPLARGDVLAFPNDNTWYDAGTAAAVIEGFDRDPGLAGLSARLVTPDGRPSQLRWPDTAQEVSRRNFYRTSIMAGLFLRRDLVRDLGGFDEEIGTGSAGWAQSGEESDVVLRALARGARIRYDPALVVRQVDTRDDPDPAFVTKMRGYGAGQGYLWRAHSLEKHRLAWVVARKLVAAPVRAATGRTVLARADLAYARGCLTGYHRGMRA
jgi:GT2 family glycosyltransferase